MFKGTLIFVVGGIFGTIFGVLVGGALGFFGGAVFWEYNDQKDRKKTDGVPTAADAVYKTPAP